MRENMCVFICVSERERKSSGAAATVAEEVEKKRRWREGGGGGGRGVEEEEAALVDIHLVRHFYPLLQLAGILARAGAAFAGNDSMFLPLSSLPTPATQAPLLYSAQRAQP